MADSEEKKAESADTASSTKPKDDEPAFDNQPNDVVTGEDRVQFLDDALGMYRTRTSGVSLVGTSINIGTLIGGDNRAAADEQDKPILDQLSGRAVDDLGRVFVEPLGYATLGEPVERYGLVLLGTRPRWGNTATAIRLLDGLKAIYALRFAGALADLPVDKLPQGSGFVLDATDARILITLRPQTLTVLQDRLRAAGSRLVVITDAERVIEHGGRPVWRSVEAPPDAYELTVRHLADRLGSREQGVEILEQAGLADQLRETTPGTFDIYRLVELAADLAEVARGRGVLAEAVERFESRADQAVEQWFDGDELADPSRKALVLALAVLDRMSFDAVSRAANLLERMWQAQEPAATPGPKRRPEPRTVRLKAARARLTHGARRTRFGLALNLEIVSFWDSGYPERLLRHYWREHDYDRDLLLEWLREIARDVEYAVGLRAANAVGLLATYGFDTIRRQVIVPWAGSGNGLEREHAAVALAMPARTAETAARTVRMVADWASRNGDSLRTSAVRALGGSVGAVLDPGPDVLLAKLAEGADGSLAIAIGDSIGELLANATAERQQTLLSLLSSWSGEAARGRQRAGVFGFLRVAWTQWVRDEGGPAWPLLLRLADSDPVMAADVAACWRNALVAPGSDTAVWLVLRQWAQAAEREADMRPAFIRLFMAVPTSRRQADLLNNYAERLRTDKPASPDTARRLLDALMKAS